MQNDFSPWLQIAKRDRLIGLYFDHLAVTYLKHGPADRVRAEREAAQFSVAVIPNADVDVLLSMKIVVKSPMGPPTKIRSLARSAGLFFEFVDILE